jgi:DNA-binding NtrC family response regulator/ABC-type branched-subunit amino acid transport system substrate-binding protein
MARVRKVGLLFSLTGATSLVESSLLEASLLAIQKTNADNGICIDPIVVDIKSNPAIAAKAAYDLFTNQKVDIVIGCYTSACRKALIPVLEETEGSLIYPTIYEGEESHPRIFYFGAIPNQQVDPLLSWTMSNLSKDFILVGSDYVYSQSTNRQVRTIIEGAGGTTLHEAYFPLGCEDFSGFLPLLRRLILLNPNALVLSTLVGKSISKFYNQYYLSNLRNPIVSPISSEVEFRDMGVDSAAGNYFADGCLTPTSKTRHDSFLSEYHRRHGGKPTNGMMSGLYDAIQLLGRSYRQANVNTSAGVIARRKVHSALKDLPYDASKDSVMMDSRTQHAWVWTRVSQITADGGIDELWKSPGPMPPRPFSERAGGEPPSLALLVRKRAIDPFKQIIGKSQVISESIQMAGIAASTSCPVLLYGETGTGKELFARAIHESSDRCKGPFVPISCAAIPRELIVSELFGYEGGSFTGAAKEGKRGKFEQANGGTLFLDEIAQIPHDLQATLLRALQENEIFRIGGGREVNLNVRIIAATNEDISPEAQPANGFRPDLFYRLNVFHIELPALRSRKKDILSIAESILSKLNIANSCSKFFSEEAMKVMFDYRWPGNIRELENWIKRAFYVANDKEIIDTYLFPKLTTFSSDVQEEDLFKSSIQASFLEKGGIPTNSERELITQALVASAHNMSRAARMLGVSRSTIYRKVKTLEINLFDNFSH